MDGGIHPGGRGGNSAHVLGARRPHAPRSSCSRSLLRGSGLQRGPRRGSALERSFTELRARTIRPGDSVPGTGARATWRCAIRDEEGPRSTKVDEPSLARIGPERGAPSGAIASRLAVRRVSPQGEARASNARRGRSVTSSRASRGSTTRRSCPCVVRVANVGRPPSGPDEARHLASNGSKARAMTLERVNGDLATTGDTARKRS